MASIDVTVSMPKNLKVGLGDTITVPVNVKVLPGARIIAATIDIFFDDNVLDVVDISQGVFWSASNDPVTNWTLTSNVIEHDNLNDQIALSLYRPTVAEEGVGDVAQVTFAVNANAGLGESTLVVQPRREPPVELNWVGDNGLLDVVQPFRAAAPTTDPGTAPAPVEEVTTYQLVADPHNPGLWLKMNKQTGECSQVFTRTRMLSNGELRYKRIFSS
tara:strand:+ start:3890 stop:4540 length:651 start_codon:yes stop_codon:yes gene_type:complete